MKQDEWFQRSGAAAWGTCAFADLCLPEQRRQAALELCPGAKGVYVTAFPYFAGYRPGNLSLYARGEDYHRVLLRRLEPVCAALSREYPQNRFVPGSDNSPLDERQCARLAGVGIQGDNGLVIVEPYGSWVFLGTILTDLPLPSSEEPARECLHCGACERSCPGLCLGGRPFDESRCLSALTQKKGVLSPEEERALQRHPLIWGCDLCQQVCPYNQSPQLSPLKDLCGEGSVSYLSRLEETDLEGLSNRTFRQKYGDRAFAWRGPAVLRRNLALKKK